MINFLLLRIVLENSLCTARTLSEKAIAPPRAQRRSRRRRARPKRQQCPSVRLRVHASGNPKCASQFPATWVH